MRRRTFLLVSLLGLLTPLAALGPDAGAAATWTQVSTGDVINFAEPALHRTADGVLHVMWPEDNESGTADILHATVTPEGHVNAPTVAQDDWHSLWAGGGSITPTADGGMAYFFGGVRSNELGDPNDNLNMITSDASGAIWEVHVGDLSPPGTTAYASTIGAAVDATMTPYQIWGSTVHRGLDASSPATSFNSQAGFGCCAYDGALATDQATGKMYAAWYSNDGPPSATNNGVWVQEVNTADGTPVGTPTRFPNSVTLYNGSEQSSDAGTRIPMTFRPGFEGIWAAWPTGYPGQDHLLIWRPFEDQTWVARRSLDRDIDHPAISATGDGRLWVAWSEGGRIFARRSETDGMFFGTAVKVRWPAGATPHDLKASAAPDGSLDVIGNFDLDAGPPQFFHVRLLPGLTVTAEPESLRREGQVKFTVTDAGDPVAGALVKIDGRTDNTNLEGIAKIRLGPYNRARRLTATATKTGYTRGKTTVRVRV